VSDLDAASAGNLRKRLREMGYSDGAVKQIMKWYKQDSSNKDV
jgi:Fe2+ transport system protein FeoA